MARPIWSGALNFGLVTVPVELYSATEDHTIHFRQFDRETSDRIRYRRVNERTGKEVPYEDIVKGYELDDGEYVLVDREELEQIAPGKSRTIDIEAFVDLGQIDPMFFQKSYWLAPAEAEFNRAYGLLIEAMAKTTAPGSPPSSCGARSTWRPCGRVTKCWHWTPLHFAADIRDPAEELRKLPEPAPARGKEVEMAVSLIESMSEDWQPGEFRDTYTERVRQLIEDKKEGRDELEKAVKAASPPKRRQAS